MLCTWNSKRHFHAKWKQNSRSTGNRVTTFESEHSAGWVHESRIGSDGSAQWLHGRSHVDDHHVVLRRRLTHADVFIRIHRHMRECDELRADSDACKLYDKYHEIRQSWNSCANFRRSIQHSVRHTEMYRKSFFHCDGSIGRHDLAMPLSLRILTQISKWNNFRQAE
jgi:hypothetical protein